jgi:hypothetical protein
MFSWYLGISRRQFTSRIVFQEGNPRDWRDRLAVDDTWTVTVRVDLGTEGRQQTAGVARQVFLELEVPAGKGTTTPVCGSQHVSAPNTIFLRTIALVSRSKVRLRKRWSNTRARLNIQKFYVLPTQWIYVFCMDRRTTAIIFPCTALNDWFLGVFSLLRKATISFVMSVCLSVRMEQLSSHWTDFH